MRFCILVLAVFTVPIPVFAGDPSGPLRVGFGTCDISPVLGKKPVYIAGFGKNRVATKVHDPLMARAVVLDHGKDRLAFVSVDLIGLFHDSIENMRPRLPGITYLIVSSTHTHEGPDTVGMWGASFFQTGVDPEYTKFVEDGIVTAVQQAEKSFKAVATTRVGAARDAELLSDSRKPFVKHDELTALKFVDADKKTLGFVVQWNCHPEMLDSRSTELSADFVASTVSYLEKKYACPVVYLTGTVGGLMSSLAVVVPDENGKPLPNGTHVKTAKYGVLIGELTEKALAGGREVKLTPFVVKRHELVLPIDNNAYMLGYRLGVLKRRGYVWEGSPDKIVPLEKDAKAKRMAIKTEVGYVRLGEVEIAMIPGEIYPELVLGKVENPAVEGADFPDAAIEPSIYDQLKAPFRMMIGLANDEIGYIIPKRQWDEKAPFCYGRKQMQYGEINSLGPETGPLICETFRALVTEK